MKTAKETIARLRERVAALVTGGVPADVVVWRHPGETEDEAIERYMRQHPEIATTLKGRPGTFMWSAGKVGPEADRPSSSLSRFVSRAAERRSAVHILYGGG